MSELIDISCSNCDADYRVQHDLGDLYIVSFCIFCGEEINDDNYEWEETDEEWN
jgi:hypothetical protein